MPKQRSNEESGSPASEAVIEKPITLSTAPDITARLSAFQRFTTRTINRTLLKNAVYNPRVISQEAKLKLRETLNRVGLVAPICWNERTGNIVGGHQRIRQLDTLEGGIDYSLTVAVVDVDAAREKELNVLLNNSEVCGDWNLELLGDLLGSEDVDLKSTGFDEADFIKMFGGGASQAGTGNQKILSEQLEDVKASYERLAKENARNDDDDFYNVIVFASYEDRRAFLEELGLKDNRYIDGRILAGLVKSLRVEKAKFPDAGSEG